MSNYQAKALNPNTDTIEVVSMLDNYFGPRHYGVMFEDGIIISERQAEIYPINYQEEGAKA